MNQLVSIIIPTFNYGKYISHAINSILNQTYKNYEILIVDDGSTDQTKNIVSSFNNSKIKYVYQQNQGANVARNRGWNESRGDFIIFLDADDILNFNHIEEYLKIAVSNPESNVYGASKKGYFCNEGFNIRYEMGRCPYDDMLESWIRVDWWIFTSCVMWSWNNLVQVGGWDESLHANQDGDIAMRALIEKVPFIFAENAPTVLVTMHNDQISSISNTKNIKTLSSRYQVLKKIEDLLKCRKKFNNKYKNALAHAYFSLAKNNLYNYHDFSDSCFKEFRRLYGYRKPPGSYMNWLGISVLGLRRKQKLAELIGDKISWRL